VALGGLGKLFTALFAGARPIEAPGVLNTILPVVELEKATGWVAQNNQAEVTASAAVTLATLTAPQDGFYRLWFDVSVKTTLAAVVRVYVLIENESGGMILVLADRYVKNIVDKVNIEPPGILLWLKKNWAFTASQQSTTGTGETLRADLTMLQLYV